jgi:hypothetical protein
VEPEEQWPTYENIVAKFKALTAKVMAGDQVYVQYSGHGGRAATVFADVKGDDGLDECLVPLDIGDASARYVRDVELYYLINDLVKKEVRLTVVFDCCNSGGATRGNGGARKRGISVVDLNARPGDSLVAPTDQLIAAWQAASGGAMRASKPASGWLLEPKGYTFMAACRANESAFEYPFNGTENNGALTYWMLDTLRQSGPNITYKTLHDRILPKVHGQFEAQTPMLQGDASAAVFGGTLQHDTTPTYTVPVLEIDPAGQRVRVNAGEVHGVTTGTQFAIYPFNTTDFDNTANRLALVEADHVNETDTWAKIIAQSGSSTLEVGAQALLIHSANLHTRRGVALVLDDAGRKAAISAAIATQGQGFITLDETERIDFQVATDEQGNYAIWDAAGADIPNLRPPLAANDPTAVETLVQRLVHLAKYNNVRDLTAPAGNTDKKLRVELTPIHGDPTRDAGGAPIYKPGDKVKLVVTNTQTPGAANDPARILNITILDLAPDWSISQIFPAGGGFFEPLDPGGTFEFEFEAFLPDGREMGVDTLKVFATQSTTNFRWLQLPALDQPPAREAIQRSASDDPLEKLLASLAGETLTTRDLRITSGPKTRGWTTAQVDLRVKAN